MKKKLRRAQLIQIFFLFLSLLSGWLLYKPLKTAVTNKSELIKEQLFSRLEQSLGIDISYERILPSFFTGIYVKGVSVNFNGGSFTAERFNVSYNILSLLKSGGKSTVSDVSGLISGASVYNGTLNLTVNSDNSNKAGKKKSGESLDIWKLLSDKTVTLNNFNVHVSLNGNSEIVSRELSLKIKTHENVVKFSFSGSFDYTDSNKLVSLGRINAYLSSEGVFSTLDSSLNGRVNLGTLKSDVAELKPVSVDIVYTDKELKIRRIDDHRPLDITFEMKSSGWEVSGEAEKLSVRDIALPGILIKDKDPWFSTVIDGSFRVSGIPGQRNINYRTSLNFDVPSGVLPWQLNAEIDAIGNRNRIKLEKLLVSSDFGNLEYSGVYDFREYAPAGLFSFNISDKILGYPVNAAFNLSTSGGAVSAVPVYFEAAGMDFKDFRFLVIKENLDIVLSLLVVPDYMNKVNESKVVLDAFLHTGKDAYLNAFVKINNVDSLSVIRLLGSEMLKKLPVTENSRISLNGFIEADRNSWAMSLESLKISDNKNPDNVVLFSGRASPGSWHVDNFKVTWNGYKINGRGYAGKTASGGSGSGRILIDENIYPVNINWHQNGRLEISGNYNFLAVLGERSSGGRYVGIYTDKMVIPYPSGESEISLDIRGKVTRNDWDIFINKAKVKLTDRKTQSSLSLGITGTLNPDKMVFPSVILEDREGLLKGSSSIELFEKGKSVKAKFFLSDGNETYNFSLVKFNKDWDASIIINNSRLGRFFPDKISGLVNAEGSLNGDIADPSVLLKFNVSDGYLSGYPFNASAVLSLDNGFLRLRDTEFRYEGISLDRGLLLADLKKGSLRMTSEINAYYNQVPVKSGFSLALDTGRPFTLELPGKLKETEFIGTLATRPLTWNGVEHFPSFTFQFIKNSEKFNIRTPDARVLDLTYNYSNGKLNVISSDPLPFSLNGGGIINAESIDLSFPEVKINPELINYVMLRDPILLQYHVVFQGGLFNGNLDIRGPKNDPGFFGTINAENLLVDTPYTYAKIKPASTVIHFDDKKISVDRIDVPIGGGIAYGYGYLVLDRLRLSEFNMTYGGKAGPGGDGVPVYYPLMGVDLDGIFTGETVMTGDGQHFELNGDFTFPYLKASLGSAVIPVQQSKRKRNPKPVFLNFKFRTGNNCVFYLPNEETRIVKVIAEPNQEISLIYSSNPENFSLTGTLPVKTGSMFYFDRDFKITEGYIKFNETLGHFDPFLSFRAEAKVQDKNNEDVTVALVYDAPIMSGINPRIETNPPRSESEILALFGKAVVPYSGNENNAEGNNAILLGVGGVISQLGIVQPFEEVLRKNLNLDMVTIQTDIIENTLAQGFSNPASNVNQGNSIGRYLDNTSFYAAKYIGNSLFLSGSVTTRYFEGKRFSSLFGGLQFETTFSVEMETPFFNVSWSYSPDTLNSENFVEDVSISLKWQFSY